MQTKPKKHILEYYKSSINLGALILGCSYGTSCRICVRLCSSTLSHAARFVHLEKRQKVAKYAKKVKAKKRRKIHELSNPPEPDEFADMWKEE